MPNRTKIDEIDAKILKTLLKESRTSFTEIAKDCKLSIGAVRMRYKRLWKAGIIKGEMMLVNPHSLGYKYISDLGIETAVENENKVIEVLKSKPYIAHIVGPLGKYNFWAKVALHEIQQLAEILEDLESCSYIEQVEALIWVEAINVEHAENLVIGPLTSQNEQMCIQKPDENNRKEARKQTKIDEIDRKIATILSQNSRKPFMKIAAQLGISTKNVIQRYKRLRGNLLILSTIIIDPNKLGYKAMASLFIKVANKGKMPEILAQILQIPNLIVTIRLIGSYDLYAAVFLADFEELFKVTEQIRRIQNIKKTDIHLTPNVPVWPLNLFPSLLQTEKMPKFAFDENHESV
jgi:Lrp/AsnC family transcriptional regulator for asnA, asnC and gidA